MDEQPNANALAFAVVIAWGAVEYCATDPSLCEHEAITLAWTSALARSWQERHDVTAGKTVVNRALELAAEGSAHERLVRTVRFCNDAADVKVVTQAAHFLREVARR